MVENSEKSSNRSRRGRSGDGGLLSSALMPMQVTSYLQRFGRCKRNGGCQEGCSWNRTDGERLPWDPNGRYGGWGGHQYHRTEPGIEGPPVVFVHGNQRDACDWDEYAEFFRERGFGGDELWAITFRDGTPTHDEMVTQLESFVTEVLERTEAEQVRIVAHSLGVTGARYWMDREERYDSVATFVGLAGPNHGQALSYGSCDTLLGHPPADLNDGDETPGDVTYYTIRGTNDALFWQCERSPELSGAEENLALRTDHDGVRTGLESKERIYRWFTGQDP